MTNKHWICDSSFSQDLKEVADCFGISCQISQIFHRRSVAGKVKGVTRNTASIQFLLKGTEAPRPMPSTMNQDDMSRRIHRDIVP
jgi:hypothetical protein